MDDFYGCYRLPGMTCQAYHKFIQGELLTGCSPADRPAHLTAILRGLRYLGGHLKLLNRTIVCRIQRQVRHRDPAQARFVRLQMRRHMRLRSQLGALVRDLQGLNVRIPITQMLPVKAALQGDRCQCAAYLSPQSQATFQYCWLYKSVQASQISGEVVVQG